MTSARRAPPGAIQRTRRGWAGLCALLLLGSSTLADKRILARDDLAFARALVQNGYPDLAEEVLATIEAEKKDSRDDRLFAQALRLELREFQAGADPDPARQGELLQEVIHDMERFVADHRGTPAADDLAERLLELYRRFGERVAGLLLDEETAGEAQKLRGAAENMFERAIDTLKADREKLAEQLDELDPNDPDYAPDYELERRAMLASYNLARAYYFHGQLLEEGFSRTNRLNNALSVLSDFQLDYPDQLLCYEGYIYEGLCLADLGRTDEALSSLDFAIALRETYERLPNGLYQVSPEAADIVSSAVLQKMLLLAKQNDAAGAAEAARDFYATIPDAGSALKGLAILGQQADALRTLGDRKGLEDAARKLIELDPRGPGGDRGRELLGEASNATLGALDTYKLAEAASRSGQSDRAIALCQQVLILARGTADEAELGAQSSLLLGALLAQRGWLHEAVVAWSGVIQRFSRGKDAPECLWRAANGYLALQAQERGSFYRDGAREVMSQLSSRFPDHPYASMASIIEGQQLEAEEQFEKAAEVYERIPAGSAGHDEALYRAGNALSGLVRKLLREGKSAEARPVTARAEQALEQARTALERSAAETLDLAAQQRLRGLAFNSRVSLANLYLIKGIDRASKVPALLEGVEREFPGDASKASTARILRMKALLAQGKVDEAVALLDQQLREDPSGKGLGSLAATLARAVDERGAAQRATSTVDADSSWRKAAGYYVLAIRGQIEGEQAVRVDELEPVANRLFALALHFNNVPEGVDSFVAWKGARLDPSLLEPAVRAYEAVLPLTPSYRTQISLARALGFLQRWDEAAAVYARLFERETFASTTSRSIDAEAMRSKPELPFAFLEWGACEREIGVADNVPERLARASAIFETLVLGTRAETNLWWLAKFNQIQTLSDRGDYEVALIAVNSVERLYPDYDAGQFGLKDRFQSLKRELEGKVRK